MKLTEKLKHYRISEIEYSRICELLGREIEGLEWALFSALWSEHCSYKSSRIHLKKLYNEGPHVLQSFGENAGVIDLGEGERIAFKMESHNHPSFIEPYQGAATGVGGILRDIFTMGARPMALANFLCFGDPHTSFMKSRVKGVVEGLSGYGNCVGVPMITGQMEFAKEYEKNILVNAFALGYFAPGQKVMTARAQGVGNCVVYVGSKTGRDGIHGASMASESFDDKSESRRPTIQIGDPFYEKLLIESCLQVISEGLVVAIQDMGAAGLTSSTFEMATSGGVGMDLYLDQVPLRDQTLVPEEILLSESQERMLLICEPQNLKRIEAVFNRWGLDAQVIGVLKKEPFISLFWKSERLTQIDPKIIVEGAPRYNRPYEKSPFFKKQTTDKRHHNEQRCESIQGYKNEETLRLVENRLREIFLDPRGCNKTEIQEYFDQRVGAQTEFDCGETIGVIRLPSSGRPLGIALGGRPSLLKVYPEAGGKDSVAFPALKLALKGFKPLALTDCLNFGNPEKRNVMGDFVSCLEGMNEVAKSLNIPIISGNVSLYNETQNQNIIPTPAIGVVGLREDHSIVTPSFFKKPSRSNQNSLFLLSLPLAQFSGQRGLQEKTPQEELFFEGDLNSQEILKFMNFLLELNQRVPLLSSRMVSRWGLLMTLIQMTSKESVGFELDSSFLSFERLFDEKCYEVLLQPEDSDELVEFYEKNKISLHSFSRVGFLTGKQEVILGGKSFPLSEWASLGHQGFEGMMYGV